VPATTMRDPNRIRPWQPVFDETLLDHLVDAMTRHGWKGAPLLVIGHGDDPLAITGSHRIEAARQVGIDVPTHDLHDLLAEHGLNLAVLDAATGVPAGDDFHYETVVRLPLFLPAVVVAFYGIDAH
jgi:ParB-like chromosome segregation protein Spo0J